MFRDMPWSKTEKLAARKTCNAAFERECRAIGA